MQQLILYGKVTLFTVTDYERFYDVLDIFLFFTFLTFVYFFLKRFFYIYGYKATSVSCMFFFIFRPMRINDDESS